MLTNQELFFLDKFSHSVLFESLSPPWGALKNLKKYFTDNSLGTHRCPIPDGVTLVHPELITMEEGVVIEPGAYIQGPCYLGAGTTVRHGAYIRGDVITGERCVIGHASEVKHSIFLDGAKAAHFAYVGDSVLGNDVNLGAGTKCANLRFDGAEVLVAGGKTGLRKLGAIFGDGAQTGCNAVTNPGAIFERGAACFPCQNVGGIVHAKNKVKISSP